jgi:hypothetical protein
MHASVIAPFPAWVQGLGAGLLTALLLTSHALAWAACPSGSTAERFKLNGSEVSDTRQGLIWSRCSLGQVWSGSACTGTARSMTLEAALQHTRESTGWRLPTIKELTALVDKGCLNPSLDSTAFPNTRSSSYWTFSPDTPPGAGAWYVHFNNGAVYYGFAEESFHVRLVRAAR